MSLCWWWDWGRMGVLQRWVVAGVGQWREQKRDLNIALQKLFPFSIPCEPCLIHRWVLLPLPQFSLNCCSPNPLFFLLIPPVFSLSPSSAPPVLVCLFSLIFMSSSWNLFSPSLSPLFFFCSVSYLLYPSLLGSAFFCDETVAHGFWGGSESSRTQWLNFR